MLLAEDEDPIERAEMASSTFSRYPARSLRCHTGPSTSTVHRICMPLPEKYRRQLMETHAAAERESRWDVWRAMARVIGEIVLWTVVGLFGIGLAFYTLDYELGMVYWWAGSIVWIAGVSAAVLAAYRRGLDRGDW
jgi:hypothetical protein